jgi:hypothetical protein
MKRGCVQQVSAALLAIASAGCTASKRNECELPALSEEEVTAIADAFLGTRSMNEEFRKTAERRVIAQGCHYEYQEAEKLDSFGVGIVVVIDRRRKVIDFYSSH